MSQKGTVLLRETDPSGNVKGSNQHLELSSGRIFDDSGKEVAKMTPMGEHDLALSDYAARNFYANLARETGKPVRMKDADGEGQLITMDLSIADVHSDFALPNYAAGYKLADSAADIASPVILVPKPSNKFNTWDSANAFRRVLPNAAGPGAGVPEVNPTLSRDNYSTVEYALSAFIPTEIGMAADAPLQPYQAAVKRVMNALRLEREIRVATLMETSGTWDSSVVKTILAAAKWNGGANSDPIKDIFAIMEASAMPVTRIIMSEVAEHAFMTNPTVQAKIAFKDSTKPLPNISELSALLSLPPMYSAKMKYFQSGTSLSYVWGNHVVLVHEPTSNPPSDQEDVASNYTFRWDGGSSPDGAMTAGFMVRTYFDQTRGGRGGTRAVVVHNDAEKQTSKLVGGLILNAIQ